ncbi:hypothetical protein BGAL_0065g00070 [Botrytis galanthina]|uniref:Uncharacterized protein n=1 Tax=Botrytis galanthina TaxID=278940 RepID=A0A4S8REF0_9HELO|nr:hypothetical protein BGAL_0065g00070 [Botrytis galanthina]
MARGLLRILAPRTTSMSSKETEGPAKFQLPSHFMDCLRTVHDNHKRTPTETTTTRIMSRSEISGIIKPAYFGMGESSSDFSESSCLV